MTAPTYKLDYTDVTSDPTHKRPLLIAPGELHTGTSLSLPGAGYAPYGEPILENLLHLMENFASATEPKNPTVGQIWYDTANQQLKFLLSITEVGSNTVYKWSLVADNVLLSETAPTNLKQLWYDTTATNPANHVLKIYNTFSAMWQAVVPGAVSVGSTTPVSTGSLWYNTSNADPGKHELYAFNPVANQWQPAASHDASLLRGSVPDSVLLTSNLGGNAATATLAANATKLATGRSITLSMGATGSVVFDGSQNVTLAVTGLNASVLSTGTVPLDRMGAAGTRAPGYYLDGSNVWKEVPVVIDSYTKTQSDAFNAARVLRDSITYAGFASNDPTLPYFRREADNQVYYLQPKLTFTPAAVSTTLAGYGITDAYTKSEVNALIPQASPVTGVLEGQGWTRFANGLTLQWGQGPALGDDGVTYVNLIRPATILNVQVTAIGVATGGVGPCFLSDAWTGTNFRVSNNYNTGPSRPWAWFAITVTPS